MEYINLENWKRKEHYEFFHRMDYPQYNICMDIDVTRFLQFTRKKDLSFYYSMIFAATTVINRVENFRYRIRNDQVVMHDRVHPSFTDMNRDPEDDLFKMVTVDLSGNIYEFVKIAGQTNDNQKNFLVPEKLIGRDDLIYITCIPWISFTHISHSLSLNRNDSVPRISWGKYYPQGEKMLLPFSVQSNHALVDGIHVGKYVQHLQTFLDEIE